MKSFLALAFAGVSSATLMDMAEYDFMRYITKYNKRYATKEEFNFRLDIFKKAHAEIEEHNAKKGTSTMGHNMYSDWTAEEFQSILGFLNLPSIKGGEYAPYVRTDVVAVDWVAAGAVTEVKN